MAEGRTLIRDGKLNLRRAASDAEVTCFLFDHMLVITRQKDTGYKIIKKPIPLALVVVQGDRAKEPNTVARSITTNQAKPQKPAKSTTMVVNAPQPVEASRSAFTLTLRHLGRAGGVIVLNASSEANRQSWARAIEAQKQIVTESMKRFQTVTLDNRFFSMQNRVNCSSSYQSRLILGTDLGVFLGAEISSESLGRHDGSGAPSDLFARVLELERVTQIDVMVEHDILLVLAGIFQLRSLPFLRPNFLLVSA